ncbi:mechanosensitive ion channel family protein [Micromonospora sp. LOL_021]|uniref:mechanosensitive ion channel family protein n=1 Tax=Micromonospora sp. LOL_021 TaxID=3345417 RepID=UPI003A85372E
MSSTYASAQVDIGNALTDMWRSVILFVPRAIAFIAILVVGWLIARAVLKGVDKALERVGFDRAVERGGIGKALERTRYDASDILARLAYYAVLLFTLQFAFGVWGPNPISDLISAVVAWLPRAFVAIVIVVVAAAIATAVRDLVSGALGGLSYGRLLATAASVFIVALGVIAALNQVGIATTVTTPVLIAVLATIAGVLIVGVGGGLVRPMQQRWEGWLTRMAEESQAMRDSAQAYQAGRDDAGGRTNEPTQVIPQTQQAPAMSGGREAASGRGTAGPGANRPGGMTGPGGTSRG